jgi:hypothetical protein
MQDLFQMITVWAPLGLLIILLLYKCTKYNPPGVFVLPAAPFFQNTIEMLR